MEDDVPVVGGDAAPRGCEAGSLVALSDCRNQALVAFGSGLVGAVVRGGAVTESDLGPACTSAAAACASIRGSSHPGFRAGSGAATTGSSGDFTSSFVTVPLYAPVASTGVRTGSSAGSAQGSSVGTGSGAGAGQDGSGTDSGAAATWSRVSSNEAVGSSTLGATSAGSNQERSAAGSGAAATVGGWSPSGMDNAGIAHDRSAGTRFVAAAGDGSGVSVTASSGSAPSVASVRWVGSVPAAGHGPTRFAVSADRSWLASTIARSMRSMSCCGGALGAVEKIVGSGMTAVETEIGATADTCSGTAAVVGSASGSTAITDSTSASGSASAMAATVCGCDSTSAVAGASSDSPVAMSEPDDDSGASSKTPAAGQPAVTSRDASNSARCHSDLGSDSATGSAADSSSGCGSATVQTGCGSGSPSAAVHTDCSSGSAPAGATRHLPFGS